MDTKLKKLKEIVDWFDAQEEIDLEIGLTKVKEAFVLIQESKSRLREIENEFEEIKKEIDPSLEKKEIVIETTETTRVEIKTEDNSSEIPF